MATTTTIPQFAGSFYIDFDGTHYCAMHGSQQMFKRNGSLAEYKTLTGAIKYFADQGTFPTQACCTCGEVKQVNTDGECNDCASLEDIEEKQVVNYSTYTDDQLNARLDTLKNDWFDSESQEETRRIDAEIKAIETEKRNRQTPILDDEPTIEDITPEQLAEIMPFAREYREHKRVDRETFAAETKLETVPNFAEAITSLQTYAGVSQDDLNVISDGILKIADEMERVTTKITPETIQQCITEVEEDNYVHVPDIIEALEKRGYTDESHVKAVLQMLEARATSGELLDVGEGFYKIKTTQRQEEVQHMEQTKPVDLNELRQLVYTAEASLQSAMNALAPIYRDHVLNSVLAMIGSAMDDLESMREQMLKQSEIMVQIEKAVALALNENGTTPEGIYVDEKYKEELQDRITVYAWNSAIEVQGQDVDIVFQSSEEMGGQLVTVFHDNE